MKSRGISCIVHLKFLLTWGIMSIFLVGIINAQTTQNPKRKITGNIYDNRGEAVIGASIREKGTANGTISDVQGHFELSVPLNSTLQVSFVGYKTKEVTVSSD